MSLLDNERFAIVDAADRARRATASSSPIRDAEARADCGFAERVLRLRRGSRLMLLGAGQLEHVRWFSGQGIRVVWAGPTVGNAASAPPTKDARAIIRGVSWRLPFRPNSFDAVFEIGTGPSLTSETDDECLAVLREIRDALAPAGRFLTGGTVQDRIATGATVSSDRTRQDQVRSEAMGVEHRTLRLARPDGTWQRIHRRTRSRGFEHVERLLERAGFSVFNAFAAYRNNAQDTDPRPSSILLCQRD